MHRFPFALRKTLIAAGMAALLCPSSGALAQQFQDQTSTRFPPSAGEYANQVTIGDLDGDGDLDLVFANGGGFSSPQAPMMLRIYINNGLGVFTDESVARTGGLTFRARGVELGDIERDGDLDIIVAQDFNGQPSLLVNNGVGFFANETAIRLPAITLSSSRGQFADIDNDNDLDLFFVNGGVTNRFGTGPCKLYLNNGMGFYSDGSAQLPAAPNNSVASPMDAIFGDIDGDLDLDIRAVGRSTNASRLYRNNGAGTFANVSIVGINESQSYSYDFGDMDGDGDLDMLGINSASVAEILFKNNDGLGTYTNASGQLTSNPNVDDNDSKWFDYDNDGDLDIIIATLGASTERIYNNNGLGTYSATAGLVNSFAADSSLDVKVADLNSDGRLDFVTAQGESLAPFVNRIYINVTGPVDTIAPTIVRTEQIPTPALGNTGPFVVRTEVRDGMTSDRGFHDKGVFLNFSMGSDRGFQQVAMKWVGNNIWRGVIPAQGASGTLSYFVTARDWANNLGTGATKFVALTLPCLGNTNGDNVVNIDDLLNVINAWGQTNTIVDISAQNLSFSPSSANVRAGDTLRWTYISGDPHTATSGSPCTSNGLFNIVLAPATPVGTYVIPQSTSGNLPYFCTPHCGFGMTGSVTVASFGADVNGDHVVNIDDLLGVITAWGDCP